MLQLTYIWRFSCFAPTWGKNLSLFESIFFIHVVQPPRASSVEMMLRSGSDSLICLRWRFTLYHGKSRLNHRLGEYLWLFQIIRSQSKNGIDSYEANMNQMLSLKMQKQKQSNMVRILKKLLEIIFGSQKKPHESWKFPNIEPISEFSQWEWYIPNKKCRAWFPIPNCF